LEVCARLDAGGLTPSAELLAQCLALGVPCVAMARPRSGGFVYGAQQLKQLQTMVGDMCDAGAHGVVFGVLAPDRTIDVAIVRALVTQCAERETVFHRAFDETRYARAALDTLIAAGVTRVLTSGQAATASAGSALIASLVAQAAGRIQILPGGTVRGENVAALIAATGVTQVHARSAEDGVIERIRAAAVAH
jgi:copper homeostasis protein